jgi:hypothetical protein
VGAREQAVTDGVCDRRFTESLVPERDRELARDDRAAQARAILDHLEEVGCLGIGERLKPIVVFASIPGAKSSRTRTSIRAQAASRRGRARRGAPWRAR